MQIKYKYNDVRATVDYILNVTLFNAKTFHRENAVT